MKALRNGSLEKIVLSKVIKCEYPTIDWGLAFQQMAEKYPQAFIFIFKKQEHGLALRLRHWLAFMVPSFPLWRWREQDLLLTTTKNGA